MKKKLLIAIVCLVAIAALFIAFLFIIRGKSKSVSDSDLVFIRTNVSSNENAFFVLEKAEKELVWPKNTKEIEKVIHWESWDAKLTAEILSNNGKTLDILNKALVCPRLQVPEIQSFEEEFKYLKGWRSLSQLSMLRAISLFHDGKEKESFDATLQVIQLGHEMENSEDVPIHYLVGSAVKNMAFHTMQQLISKSSLPCKAMLHYEAQLDQLSANESALTNVLKIEYQLQKKFVDDFVTGKGGGMTNSGGQPVLTVPKFVLDPEKTRQIYAQFARTGLKSIRETYNNVPAHPVGYSTNRSLLSYFLSGNAVGQILTEMSISPQMLMSRKCRENVNVAVTRTIIALKCYKEKYGSLPASLQELVPEFLSTIPMDDFDGKPLRYSVEKKIIYSIGPDLIDSGGEEKDAKKKALDIPFKIEF